MIMPHVLPCYYIDMFLLCFQVNRQYSIHLSSSLFIEIETQKICCLGALSVGTATFESFEIDVEIVFIEPLRFLIIKCINGKTMHTV